MTNFKVVRYWDTYPEELKQLVILRNRQKRYAMNILETASLCMTI